jgi:hypothetical protein
MTAAGTSGPYGPNLEPWERELLDAADDADDGLGWDADAEDAQRGPASAAPEEREPPTT